MGYPGSGGEANNMGFDVFYGYNCQRKAHSYYPEYLWNNQEKEYQNGRYSQDAIHEHAMKFTENNKDKAFQVFSHIRFPMPNCANRKTVSSICIKVNFKNPTRGTTTEIMVQQLIPGAQFAAMITRLDTYVGQIIDKLEELGISEKTLFIFTSDNGPHNEGGADPTFFNTEERLRGLKRALYEGGMRVPLYRLLAGDYRSRLYKRLDGSRLGYDAYFRRIVG